MNDKVTSYWLIKLGFRTTEHGPVMSTANRTEISQSPGSAAVVSPAVMAAASSDVNEDSGAHSVPVKCPVTGIAEVVLPEETENEEAQSANNSYHTEGHEMEGEQERRESSPILPATISYY